MSSGRKRTERIPSGSAVSSVVSKFSQKSQDSVSKDRPPSRSREPLAPRENITNKIKGPKSPVLTGNSINKSKPTASQTSLKSSDNKDRTNSTSTATSVQSYSRRSSDASTGTDISIPTSPNEDLTSLEKSITPQVSLDFFFHTTHTSYLPVFLGYFSSQLL